MAKEISLTETKARGDSSLALALAGTEPASVAQVSERSKFLCVYWGMVGSVGGCTRPMYPQG